MKSNKTESELLVVQLHKTLKSLERLKEALAVSLSQNPLALDATIQRFEFTFENLWKLVKIYLKVVHGVDCYSPKSCFSELVKIDNTVNERFLLKLLHYRNLTVHTYDENTAAEVYAFIQGNIQRLEEVIFSLKEQIE